MKNTAMEKLNLVCTSNQLIGIIGSFYYFGQVLAIILFSFLADYVGRKFPFVVGLLVRALGLVILMLASSLSLVYIGNFVFGFADILCIQIGLIYSVELAPQSKAVILSQTFRIIDSLFYIVAAFILLVTKDMFAIYYALFCAIGLGTFGVACSPESPTFLLKKRKFGQLNSALERIRKLNCAPELEDSFSTKGESGYSNTEKKTPSLKELCAIGRDRYNLIAVTYGWSVVIFGQQLLQYAVEVLEGSTVQNVLLLGLAGVAGNIAFVLSSNRFAPHSATKLVFVSIFVCSLLFLIF